MTGPDAILDNQGLLSDASMEALELRHQPFNQTPADGDLFEDDATRSLIADINGALYGSDDVLLVLGTPGSGRTTLLRQLSANSQSRIACFSVKGSERFDTAHLFGSILEAFKTPVPSDLKDALDALVPNLQGTFERYNRLSTIVLDDADEVPVEELTKLLSSVLYLNGQEEPLLRVLLGSNPEFEERLPDALPEGAEIRYASLLIEPMDTVRAENYLEFRLNQAGYFEEFPFTDRDMQTIMEESEGFAGPLNSAAALNLNAQHGQLPESMLPPELVERRGSGNIGKMLLGGLACVMILSGLLMFSQNDGERSPAARTGEEYRTVETVPVTPAASQTNTELELVDSSTNTIPTAEETATVVADNSATAGAAADTAVSETTATATDTDAAPEPAESANSDADLLADTNTTDAAPSEPDTAAAADTNTAAAASDTAPATPSVLESATWIMVQDPKLFTVQMSASTDRASVESFLSRNDLPPPNSIFSFNRNGATWFALVHGLFGDVSEARNALKTLPEGALRNQPWIRRIGKVQDSLKDNN